MPLGPDFDDVLQAARDSAQWAWLMIYRDLAPVVLGYLRARGAAEPEDLTGDVFLQVVRNLPRFDGTERDFRAWVLTIAHRRVVDEHRRRSRSRAEPALETVLERRGEHGDSEAEALEALAMDRVRDIIGRLTVDQRDVLLLRIFGQLTVEEVARALGKRPTAVKALQRRALAALRRAIQAGEVSL